MIINVLSNTSPYGIESGNAVKLVANTISTPLVAPDNDVCVCDFQCEFISTVFADVGGDDWKNDEYTFPFKGLVSGDTITIKLYKNGIELATITDDTYGTLIDGYPPTAHAAAQLYKVFTIEFEKVMNLEGAGIYQVKADLNITGVISTFESQKFKLLQYNKDYADGTVRIDSVQNGNIIRSQFDWTGLELGFSVRIDGKLNRITPDVEKEDHLKQNYELDQVQDSTIDNWELESRMLPVAIMDLIIYNMMVANSIEVTDYNQLNDKFYLHIPLTREEFEKDRPELNVNSQILIKLKDRFPNQIKRNY